MLLEYMQRRSDLETEEFDNIVQQNMNQDMATSVKTMFEVAEERAELRAEKRARRSTLLRGKLRGITPDILLDISKLPQNEVEMLLKGYEQVYDMWQHKDFENKRIEHLTIEEVNTLLEWFDENL
jgi:hypothetical protein